MTDPFNRFELKQYHIDLARRLYITGHDGPTIDEKRPYGSSSVAESIAKIVGEPWPDEDALDGSDFDAAVDEITARMMAIHGEMATALQIILGRAGKETRPGHYKSLAKLGRPEWTPNSPETWDAGR